MDKLTGVFALKGWSSFRNFHIGNLEVKKLLL
jgi:hypothetical protein